MDKKYALVGTVWVIVVVAVLLTHSFLPPMLKENLDLYETHEYSQMYLENDTYNEVIIEYDYVSSYEPTQTAKNILEKRIEEYTDKEEIITDVDDEIRWEHTSSSYDRNDISDMKEAYMDHERGGETISIHVLYLNGFWEGNPEVLGLSKKPYSIVVFQGVIESFADETNLEPEKIEPAVLVHEFGHLLSLVGTGYESDHQTADSYHCNEEAGPCVMAEAVEFKDEEEQEAPPTDFCELCEEDLEYIRDMEEDLGLVNLITTSVMGIQTLVGVGVSITIIFLKNKKRPPNYTYESTGWDVEDDGIIQYEDNMDR